MWRLTFDEEVVEVSLYFCRLHGQRLRSLNAHEPDFAVDVAGQGSVQVLGPRDRIELLAREEGG